MSLVNILVSEENAGKESDDVLMAFSPAPQPVTKWCDTIVPCPFLSAPP